MKLLLRFFVKKVEEKKLVEGSRNIWIFSFIC